MQELMQAQTQPFVKLAQANMELLTRFSTSPEVNAQASANLNQLFQQANESAMKLVQSGAFSHLMQGMLNNYITFLTERSQGGLVVRNQAQAAMIRQAQEATSTVTDATETRGRRARKAA